MNACYSLALDVGYFAFHVFDLHDNALYVSDVMWLAVCSLHILLFPVPVIC